MAKGTIDVNISIEKALHDVLIDAFQDIANKHEIFIKSVTCNWCDVSTGAGIHMILSDMDIHTHTKK